MGADLGAATDASQGELGLAPWAERRVHDPEDFGQSRYNTHGVSG